MLRAIATAKKKNDQVDASKIADCLRCDFLPESHMMPRPHRAFEIRIGGFNRPLPGELRANRE
jgi:hypothetical protein